MTTNTPRPQPSQRPPRWRGLALYAALLVLVTIALLEALGVIALEDLLPGRGSDRRVHFITDASAPLAAFYTPEVLHWRDEIREWARTYQVNPNVLAIVIQIESCGDATAISSAGALGLMQVMPFHFEYGENMISPQTNVQRGMEVFQECLTVFAEYDLGLALACYNGGPSVTQRRYQDWYPETRYYYDWATGLWQDVQAGVTRSETLARWLAAGGQRLCEQAARSQ
ncbi:MAG: transglycosylase SLT domain-containing protein [Anaerolineae bacterium]|nr:transglycosylase SLT domain-containing protein [Anaerolineae bacterium]